MLESVEIEISVKAINSLSFLALYIPVCLVAFKRLPIMGLRPGAKQMAIGMLVAQVVAIVLAVRVEPSSAYMRNLLNYHGERDILSTLASTQLALAGGVALTTAWIAKIRPSWQRLYFVALGIVFLFLAADEYLSIHEFITHWQIIYSLLGAAVVLPTLIVAWHGPRSQHKWSVCLLVGLAMSAAGAILLESHWLPCGYEWEIFRITEGCFDFAEQEESLEFLGIWLALVALLGKYSDSTSATRSSAKRLLYAMPALWLLLLFLYSLTPRLALRLMAQPAAIQFESGVRLLGHRIDGVWGEGGVHLYISARQVDFINLGYSIHLVDQVSGVSVASRDKWAEGKHGMWLFGPEYMPVYQEGLALDIPPEAPSNRALWIILSFWRKRRDEYIGQGILDSDYQLLSDSQAILGELILPAEEATLQTSPIAAFDNGFEFVDVALPAAASPGDKLDITMSWRNGSDSNRDYTQFLHFVHSETGEQWGHDQPPLGQRLPTRLWYKGLADSETWRIPLPAALEPGVYDVYTGLYRSSDNERAAAYGAHGELLRDGRIHVGSLPVKR